jgi:hypothetical protein
MIGDLSTTAILSGWHGDGKNAKKCSLLQDGDNKHWLFKDLTTFASKRPEARLEIASYLREIWDGELVRNTGKGPERWRGKITCIAAATPAIEEYWSVMRGLGERFFMLRWTAPDHTKVGPYVRAQQGHEFHIRTRLQSLTQDLLVKERFKRTLVLEDGIFTGRLDALATILAQVRVHISRDSDHARSITKIPEPELQTRIAGGMAQIIRANVLMDDRDTPGEDDFALAYRLALDSIPWALRRILEATPHEGGRYYGEILEELETPFTGKEKVPKSTLMRRLDDMIALNIIEFDAYGADWSFRKAELTPRFRQLCNDARIKFRQPTLTPVKSISKPKISPKPAPTAV